MKGREGEEKEGEGKREKRGGTVGETNEREREKKV